MMKLGVCLMLMWMGGVVRSEGYGAEPAPPSPPAPEPYPDPMEEAAAAMEELEEILASDEEEAYPMPAPEEEEAAAEEAAPAEEAGGEAAYEPPPPLPPTDAPATDAPAAEDGNGGGYSDMGGGDEGAAAEGEGDAAAAEEEAGGEGGDDGGEEGGYRAALKGARKRVVSWSAVRESDVFLQFVPSCRDHHSLCPLWAAVRKGSRHPVTGEKVAKSECFRNKFLLSASGCPYSCGLCTSSRRDWAVRRRLAMRKRALRLKAKKNLN